MRKEQLGINRRCRGSHGIQVALHREIFSLRSVHLIEMFVTNRKIVAAVLCFLPHAVTAGNTTSLVAPQGAEVLTVAVIGGES